MANKLYLGVNDSFFKNGGFEYQGDCEVGKRSNASSGALRFSNLQIAKNQSIISAELIYEYGDVGTATTGDWKFDTYGIDEDNTADFSSNPLGRSRTTASIATDTSRPTSGGAKTFDVKSILEEITTRSGWSSGNSVGFLFIDDGSDADVFADCDIDNTYLLYRLTAEPDFFPTPGTVSAPTFPEASDYGLKVSKLSVDVGTASEDELLLTTRKKVFKVLNEGTLDVSSGTASYTHNLGYNPAVLGYIKGTATGETRMYKLNKIYKPYTNPDVGGYVVSGTTVNNVRTGGLGTTGFVYLYTFIDPLT
jgi:hypothetical protein